MPYGAGQHPYLSPGEGPIDACTLELAAATRLLNDERHQVPVAREPVRERALTSAAARTLGEQQIDDAFTDLARDGAGRATRASVPRRTAVELWVDEHYPFLQVYSGDTLAPGAGARALGRRADELRPERVSQRRGAAACWQPGSRSTTSWGVRLGH